MQVTAHRTLQKFCDEALDAYGITKTQWLIIGTILDSGPNGVRTYMKVLAQLSNVQS